MAGGNEFKVVFDAMDTAKTDALRAASDLHDQMDEQVSRMQGLLGGSWGDDAAEGHFQAHQIRAKATGYHTDGITAEGNAYGNVGDIGQQTLRQAINIVSNI